MGKITLYFKDIFEDLNAFKAAMAIYSSQTTTDAIHATTFKYLYNHYANSNVAYFEADAFCRHFFLAYDDVIEQFKKRLELIGMAYQVTAGDIETLNQTLNAIANNDDTALTDPLDTLASYVSMQQGSKTKTNKLLAYLEAVDKIKDKMLIDFVRQFNKLFFWLAPNEIELY